MVGWPVGYTNIPQTKKELLLVVACVYDFLWQKGDEGRSKKREILVCEEKKKFIDIVVHSNIRGSLGFDGKIIPRESLWRGGELEKGSSMAIA